MLKTIKPNKGYWSKKVPFLKVGRPDPLQVFSSDEEKFSNAMETFKFKQVVKQTQGERHKLTQLFLNDWIRKLPQSPVILDIGASDGSTSLRLIDMIHSFEKYYVTDYNITCSYLRRKGYTYFFEQSGDCFLVASNKFVFYPNKKWFFDFLFKKSLLEIKDEEKKKLLLINKKLKSRSEEDSRIEIMQYDIFEKWPQEKANIVIVANLLNRYYFNDDEIKNALINCYDAVSENGILVIVRNLPTEAGEIEKSNVYQKNISTKSFRKINEINGGIEFDDLLLSLRF